MAFSRTAKVAGIKLPESFQQMWPINLRKYLDLGTPQPMACFTTFTSTVHSSTSECDLDTFWEVCQNVFLKVKNESEKEKLRSTIRSLNICCQILQNARWKQLQKSWDWNV